MTKKDVVKYICYATALCSLQVGAGLVAADEVGNVSTLDNVPALTNTQTTDTNDITSETVNTSTTDDNTTQSVIDSTNQVNTNQVVTPETSVQNQENLSLTSTNDQVNLTTTTEDTSQTGTQAAHTGDYHEDFNAYDDTTMERSDWFNGNPFDCRWVPKNTVVNDGTLTLTIDQNTTDEYRYNGAEWRTREFFGYGMYSVRMQPISNPGVVSSFFTYTGPSDNNPWDEIDIEFLGKDTTKVQFNYYTNGVGGHEFLYDLGFDASESYHVYGFDWQADHITWYVDGVAVYTATENLPVTPGKIMMNAWPGIGVDDWLAPYDGQTPLVAYYDWISYSDQVAQNQDNTRSRSKSNTASKSRATGDVTGNTSTTTKGTESVTPTKNSTASKSEKQTLVLDNHSKGSTKEKQAASPVIKTVAYSSVASAQTAVAKTVTQSVAKANLEGSAFTALPKTNQRPSKLLTISGVFVALLGFLAMPFKKGKL